MEAKSAPHPRKTFPGTDSGKISDGLRSDEDGRFAGLTTGAPLEPVAGQVIPGACGDRPVRLSDRTLPPCWILEARCLDYNQFRTVGRAEQTESPDRNPRLGDRCPSGSGPQGKKRNIMPPILATWVRD